MSLRKRVEAFESDMYVVNLAIRDAERRLKRLECDHSFRMYERIVFGEGYFGICQKCGKTVSKITTEEYLLIEKERLASELKNVTVKLGEYKPTKKK